MVFCIVLTSLVASMEETDDVFHKTLSTSVMYSGQGGDPLPISPTSRNPNSLPKSLLKRFESLDGEVTHRNIGNVGKLKEKLKLANEQVATAVLENEKLSKELGTTKDSFYVLDKDYQGLKQAAAETQKSKDLLEKSLKEMQQQLSQVTSLMEEKGQQSEQREKVLVEELQDSDKARAELLRQVENKSKECDVYKQDMDKQMIDLNEVKKENEYLQQENERLFANLEAEKSLSQSKEIVGDLELQ